MMYKLTDDQKDLIMSILYDLDNIEGAGPSDTITMKTYLTTIYNNGKYDDSEKMTLNTISFTIIDINVTIVATYPNPSIQFILFVLIIYLYNASTYP